MSSAPCWALGSIIASTPPWPVPLMKDLPPGKSLPVVVSSPLQPGCQAPGRVEVDDIGVDIDMFKMVASCSFLWRTFMITKEVVVACRTRERVRGV